MRAFLAIPVLPPALEVFHALRARLVADIPAVRWAPAESPHITLHFFGTISDIEAHRAVAAVQPVVRAQRPLTLRLDGFGSFPTAGHPRVLWWGVDGEHAELTATALACRTALRAAGFEVEERQYRAHCTVGRPRQPWPAAARERWLRLAEHLPSTPSFTADRAILYQSCMTTHGATHRPVEVLALGTAVT